MTQVGHSVLVAGIGNVLLGDDGFGSEVARKLAGRPLRGGVRVVDYGVRSVDLAFALAEGWDSAILLDATARGGAPGTVYLIEVEAAAGGAAGPVPVEGHGMTPAQVLALARSWGSVPEQVLVVGCEPESFGDDGDEGGRLGLSAPVADGVERAVALVEELCTSSGSSRR